MLPSPCYVILAELAFSKLRPMKKFRAFILITIVFAVSCATVKTIPLTDEQLKSNLKKHITTLTSTPFEGRETGNKGEQLAAEYIEAQFKDVGLKPAGEKKFIQEFS